MTTGYDVTLSVSDCVAFINQTLEYAYPSVTVVGEVSSFKVNQGKFVFFDLKDKSASLSCFMMIYQLRQPMEDGMKVEVVAQPKLTAWGKFSLTVRTVRPVGEGSMKRAFELLKKKLEAEGLFDPSRKRLLPVMPQHVGVISSTQAAGYADFIKILNDRWGGMKVDVAHVQVQGESAPLQVVKALSHFNEMADPPEAVVIIRGGGSADDLAAFNDEPLVRAIAASRVPTLVGIGHEVDVTLAELAADVRAATPSNAAQLLVPDRREVIARHTLLLKRAVRAISLRFTQQRQEVSEAHAAMLRSLCQRVERLRERHMLLVRMLSQLDPRRVLQRGYALVRDENGAVLHKPPQKSEEIRIELATMEITAGVIHVNEK